MRLWPSQATASVQAVFKDFRPPFSFVNGQCSTMCNIDWTWPHSQFGLSRRPHLCSVSAHIPWLDLYRLSIDHFLRGRLNPGNGVVGSDTSCFLGGFWPQAYVVACGHSDATIEVWSSVAKCSLIIPLFHTNIRIILRIIRRLAIPRKYPGWP